MRGIKQIRKQGEPMLRGFHQGHQEGPRVAKSSPASASLEVVKDGVATSDVDERCRANQRNCELSEDVWDGTGAL